jgi:hypothetical protein
MGEKIYATGAIKWFPPECEVEILYGERWIPVRILRHWPGWETTVTERLDGTGEQLELSSRVEARVLEAP